MPLISPTPQRIGTFRRYELVLFDETGIPWTLATGSEPLAAAIFPDGGGQALARPSLAWLDPASASIVLAVTPDDLLGLDPGTYGLALTATIGGQPYDLLAGGQIALGPTALGVGNLPPAADLFGAIRSYLLADAPLAAIVGSRAWYMRAPKGARLPYLAYGAPSSVPRWAFEAASWSEVRISVGCYAVDEADAEAAGDRVVALLQPDPATALSWATGREIARVVLGGPRIAETATGPNGSDVYRRIVDCLFQVDGTP